MKALAACMLVVIAVPFTLSQEPASSQTPPDLIVLKQSWDERNVFRMPDSSTNPAAPDGKGSPEPFSADSFSRRPFPMHRVYAYKARVKNTGSREIKAMSWDYVFIDAGTEEEVGRHQFYTSDKVGPGKEVTIVGTSPSPPSRVVSVAALSKDAKNPYTEQIMLKCISYSDGTVWKHPSFTKDCPPRKQE